MMTFGHWRWSETDVLMYVSQGGVNLAGNRQNDPRHDTRSPTRYDSPNDRLITSVALSIRVAKGFERIWQALTRRATLTVRVLGPLGRMVLLAVIALALGGCVDVDHGEATPPAGLDLPTAAAFEEGMRKGMPFQREILSDGVVTYAEYERSVLASIACMREAGLEVVGPQPAQNGQLLMYSYGGTPDLEGLKAAESEADRCYRDHEEYVIHLYLAGIRPTWTELEERTTGYARCLVEAGLAVTGSPRMEELDTLALNAGEYKCVDRWSLTASVQRHKD